MNIYFGALKILKIYQFPSWDMPRVVNPPSRINKEPSSWKQQTPPLHITPPSQFSDSPISPPLRSPPFPHFPSSSQIPRSYLKNTKSNKKKKPRELPNKKKKEHMTSDNANAIATATQLPRVPPRAHHQAPGSAVATNAESIPCPRCDSNNTKFCYYNNYNLSQPRHFCKSCRRYWTHGGTLRNVPVGGGTRKPISTNSSSSSSSSANKRPRCSPAIVPPCSSSYAFYGHNGVSANGARTACSVGVKGASAPSHGAGCELGASLGSGFSSPLSGPGSNTVLALGGYGLGYVPALDGIGFGFNNGVWPFPDADLVEGASYSGFRGPIIGPAGVDAWNVGGSLSNAAKDGEVGVGGLIDGEAFPWPELAISMPGQGLK